MRTRAIWMIGPLLGVTLLVTALIVGFGPGFLMLSLFATIGFAIGVPIIQIALSQTAAFQGRELASCLIGVAVVVLGIIGGIVSGQFFYW